MLINDDLNKLSDSYKFSPVDDRVTVTLTFDINKDRKFLKRVKESGLSLEEFFNQMLITFLR